MLRLWRRRNGAPGVCTAGLNCSRNVIDAILPKMLSVRVVDRDQAESMMTHLKDDVARAKSRDGRTGESYSK